MNNKIKSILCLSITFMAGSKSLEAEPSIKFLNNKTLLIAEEESLGFYDTASESFSGHINLPLNEKIKRKNHKTTPQCTVLCAQEEIFVIANAYINTLWQLNAQGSWDKITIAQSNGPKPINSKLYSSSNGRYQVNLIYRQDKKYEGITQNISQKLSQKIKNTIANDINTYDIQISNDGNILLLLGYAHTPILIKEQNDTPLVCMNLTQPLRVELVSEATLSPQGKYVLIKSNEFLIISNTQTLQNDYIMRLNKDKSISVYPWTNLNSAFKMCKDHNRLDVCYDRSNSKTTFCNFSTLFSDFSEDENRLLLITKQSKFFDEIQDINVHIFDFKQKKIIWESTLEKTSIHAAAISANGANIALLDSEKNLLFKNLSE
jgi:hypothetical protein